MSFEVKHRQQTIQLAAPHLRMKGKKTLIRFNSENAYIRTKNILIDQRFTEEKPLGPQRDATVQVGIFFPTNCESKCKNKQFFVAN